MQRDTYCAYCRCYCTAKHVLCLLPVLLCSCAGRKSVCDFVFIAIEVPSVRCSLFLCSIDCFAVRLWFSLANLEGSQSPLLLYYKCNLLARPYGSSRSARTPMSCSSHFFALSLPENRTSELSGRTSFKIFAAFGQRRASWCGKIHFGCKVT